MVKAAFSSEPVKAEFSSDQIPVLRAFQALNSPGLDGPVSRELAMQVPAVQSGRNLICGVSTLPLVQYDAEMRAVDHPFLGQIERNRPNLLVLADTIEDLLMERVAWWRVTERSADGYPYKGEHVATHRVTVSEERGRKVVRVDGKTVRAQDLIKFESPNCGLLNTGGKPIRRALLVDLALSVYAGNPRALDYFTEREGHEGALGSVEEVDEMLAGWREGSRTNSTRFVPRQLEYNTVDIPAGLYDSLLKMGQAATIDIANLLNLDSEDFNISTTSRTYFNADQKRKDRINDVLAPYMAAITSRLSMGDVTKRGYIVRFDDAAWLDPDPLTRVQYYTAMKALGAITPEEIRRREKLAPLDQPIEAAPAQEEVPTDGPD
jgi:hypothetical protein